MRAALLAVGVIALSVLLLADDRHVSFDPAVDFLRIKTFTLKEVAISSSRPEFYNPLFAKQLEAAVRSELTRKGLKETTDHPDVVVAILVTALDYAVGRRPVIPVGGRARGADSAGPVAFTDGSLIIEMSRGNPAVLVWHGVSSDARNSAAKIAEKLPDAAKKLLAEYPPKKKK